MKQTLEEWLLQYVQHINHGSSERQTQPFQGGITELTRPSWKAVLIMMW
jgi:hypothetical protein